MKSSSRIFCSHAMLCCMFLTVISPIFLQAQQQIGKPEIINYDYQQYNASPQNWWAVEGNNGLMYFANINGVLEFDGVNWRLIKADGLAGTRSLGKGEDGTIYVGSSGEFGFLKSDEYGHLTYQSLVDKIPEEHKAFADVWEIENYRGKTYFTTNNKFYSWDGDKIEVMVSEDMFHLTSVVNGKLYNRIWNRGLSVLENGEFHLVPGGEKFADMRVYEMLPYDESTMLLGTNNNGFFLYDGKTFTPFKTELDELVKDNIYLPGVALPDGNFIVNTINQGAYLMGHDGSLLQKYTTQNGLKSESVTFAYVDSRNVLWLTTNGGISSVDLQSPFTYLEDDSGIPSGGIYAVSQNDSILYVTTNNGIYYRLNGKEKFTHMEGTSGQAFSLVKFKDRLYAGLGMGLIELKGENFQFVKKSRNYDFRINAIFLSEEKPDNMVTLSDGKKISSLYFDKDRDQFTEVSSINIIYQGAILDEKDNIWITNFEKGELSRIDPEFRDGKLILNDSEIKKFDTTDGLPEKSLTFFKVFGKVYFVDSVNNSFVFNPETQSFEKKENPFQKWINLHQDQFVISEGPEDNLFMALGNGVVVARKGEDSIHINSATFRELRNVSISDIYAGPVKPNGTQEIWFASVDGLIHYDGKLEKPKIPEFDLNIRNIRIAKDSLLYAGGGSLPSGFKLDYKNNSIIFDYAAPLYVGQQYVEYSTKLEGLDSKWSEYSKQVSREYVNLPPGSYTFKAKARSILGKTTDEVSVPFSIAKPWYLTWWSYILYALLLLTLIYFIVNRRTKILRVRQKILEENVEERTREVQQRLGELATINHITTALTEKLELNELIKLVGEEMKKLFNSDITYLALIDRANNIINFPYQDGDNMSPQEFGKGLTSKIISTGEPLLINRDKDIVAEFSRLGVEEYGKRATSYLGVPIPVEDKIIGVLSVQSTQHENRFNGEDKRLLSTIATNVGVAIHNAELFEEAREAKAKAEEANEAKSAFLSTVSHELRTPLTSVLGFAKIIRKRLEDKIFPAVNIEDQKIKRSMKQVSENLDVVVSEGERLTNLINDVLDLAKIESGRMEWNMKPVFLQDVVNRAIASTKSLFDHKGISLKKNVQKDLPMVQADEDKLIQVVINLLSNAVKFTEKGKVTIEAYVEKEQIIVEVQDTGIGIAEEDKHKVFEKFRQAGDTLTDKPKGTGLGLPICREIIEHHGGIIWMKSEPGVGSTFFFSVPSLGEGAGRQPIQLDRILKSLKKQISHSTQKANLESAPTILVVDDATPIRSLLRQELSEAGYRVKEASDGKSALDIVRTSAPDLIILDVMMPEINGFDVAAVLKNDPATMDIPIIILSIVQDKERGLRIGVDRYLTKPINTEELFHEVDVLLEQGVSKKKVLVVDEDSSAVKSLSEVLSARGYKVMESNTENFISTATESQPDIIMLNSIYNGDHKLVKDLKLQKGMENVMFFIYK